MADAVVPLIIKIQTFIDVYAYVAAVSYYPVYCIVVFKEMSFRETPCVKYRFLE